MPELESPLRPQTPAAWRAFVLERAAALGFELAGVAAAEAWPELSHFAGWLAAGRAAGMHYLARPAPAANGQAAQGYAREDIRRVFPWARSVVCCGQLYNTPPPRSIDSTEPGRGWISRYAWGDDYHLALKKRLEALADAMRAAGHLEEAAGGPRAITANRHAELRVYVDTGPLVERVYARHAGLGWQAKNTCLIHPRLGSYFFLGALVCSFEIAADDPLPDRCGSCRRCIEACPTQALDPPYQMDAGRCLAYLNIEHRGAIPEPFRELMGKQVFGCDICQDVCPWNRKAPITLQPEFQPQPGRVDPELEHLAMMSEEEYREKFHGSAVTRTQYAGLLRNVALAMGNSRLARFRPALEKLAAHPHPVVREQAEWSLARLDEVAPQK